MKFTATILAAVLGLAGANVQAASSYAFRLPSPLKCMDPAGCTATPPTADPSTPTVPDPTAPLPQLSVSEAGGVHFGDVVYNVKSATKSVTLTNAGGSNLSVSSVGIASNSAEFSQQNNCGTVLAASASCSINLSVTGIDVGARAGTLAIVTPVRTFAVPLSATVPDSAAPQLDVSESTGITFGNIVYNLTSAVKTVKLTNAGPGVLTVSSVGIATNPAEFSQQNDCGATLAKSASCSINLSVTPTDIGARSGVLAIVTPVKSFAVPLSATSGAGGLSITDATFGSNISINGNLTSALRTTCQGLSSCTFNPANLMADPWPAQTKHLLVHYTCSNSGVAKTYSWTANEAGFNNHTIACVAEANFVSTGAPSTNAFAGTAVAATAAETKTYSYQNTGTAVGSLTAALTGANAADFKTTGSGCDSVGVGKTCSFAVSFKPTAAGARLATLTINGSAIALTGTATSSIATVQSGSLAFGTVAKNATKPTTTLVIKNTGTVPMTLTGLTGLPPSATYTGVCTDVPANGTCSYVVTLNTATAGNWSVTASTAGATTNASIPFSAIVAAPNTLAIVNATYGSNIEPGTGNLNVKLRELCDGKASCTFNPPALIGDPYPGKSKRMVIDYTCADVAKNYSFLSAEAGSYNHTLTCN